MLNLYERNGLLLWTEEELRLRRMLADHFVDSIKRCMQKQNRAFQYIECEASQLTPKELVNANYTENDVFKCDELVLRPETTMGSYALAKYLLNNQTGTKLPICVWQHGKSFRKEQDHPTKYMRLKEFYQLEFQHIYSLSTKCEYEVELIPAVKTAIAEMIGPCRVEPSDRLPDYAEWTKDVICEATDMEVCSISMRKDFENAKVLEVAIGTDRCVYNFLEKRIN